MTASSITCLGFLKPSLVGAGSSLPASSAGCSGVRCTSISLIGVRDRFVVAFTWLSDYVTFQRSARLITEVSPAEKG